MKPYAERKPLRPPSRGYIAACPRCGLEVMHSNVTKQPTPQHLRSKACASLVTLPPPSEDRHGPYAVRLVSPALQPYAHSFVMGFCPLCARRLGLAFDQHEEGTQEDWCRECLIEWTEHGCPHCELLCDQLAAALAKLAELERSPG